MFSPQQKREIAMKVQAILQETAHDELPAGEVNFLLHIDGAEGWSWANIRNSSARDVEVPEVLVQNLSTTQQSVQSDTSHACGWCHGKQELVWACPVCDYS